MVTCRITDLRRVILFATGLALFLVAATASPQAPPSSGPERVVFVNGELLDEQGLALVDQLYCGEVVPDGVYWLDLANRVWGYVGTDDQFALPDCSGVADEAPAEEDDCESKYRFIEDRMCYCHGIC